MSLWSRMDDVEYKLLSLGNEVEGFCAMGGHRQRIQDLERDVHSLKEQVEALIRYLGVEGYHPASRLKYVKKGKQCES